MPSIAAPVLRELPACEIQRDPQLRQLAELDSQPADQPSVNLQNVDRDPADLLVEAVLDAQAYRTLAQEAIHALHDLTQRHDRLREQHARLREEYRCLRATTMRTTAAAS